MGKTEDDYEYLWGKDDPWAPTDEETRGDYVHDIERQRELDDERTSDSKQDVRLRHTDSRCTDYSAASDRSV